MNFAFQHKHGFWAQRACILDCFANTIIFDWTLQWHRTGAAIQWQSVFGKLNLLNLFLISVFMI